MSAQKPHTIILRTSSDSIEKKEKQRKQAKENELTPEQRRRIRQEIMYAEIEIAVDAKKEALSSGHLANRTLYKHNELSKLPTRYNLRENASRLLNTPKFDRAMTKQFRTERKKAQDYVRQHSGISPTDIETFTFYDRAQQQKGQCGAESRKASHFYSR